MRGVLLYNYLKPTNLFFSDFKTKRENYKSSSIIVIVLKRNSYPYVSISEAMCFINLVGYISSRSYENRTSWKVYARQLNLTRTKGQMANIVKKFSSAISLLR